MNKFLDDYAKAPLDHEAVTNIGMQVTKDKDKEKKTNLCNAC